MKYLIFLITCFSFYSCISDEDKFYVTTRQEDLYRLPLIKPYQLIRATEDKEAWQLNFFQNPHTEDSRKPDTAKYVNVCNINIQRDIIYGHCMNKKYYPNHYFIIDTKLHTEKIFETEKSWMIALSNYDIDGEKLYAVLNLYKNYKEDRKSLPWYQEIKKLIVPVQ